MNSYTITIQNNTGVYKDYALFTAKPEITGQVQPQIWSNVFCTAGSGPDDTARFVIYKQFYAMKGSSSGSIKSGATVKVGKTVNVTLGKTNDDGSVTPGTSLNYITTNEGTESEPNLFPNFDPQPLPSGGQPGCFEIQTTGPFTPEDVSNGNWVIGVSGSVNDGKGPAAVFAPIPNQSYQIKPVNQFWIATGQYVQGKLVDYTMVSKTAFKVDFSKPGAKSEITINHTPKGTFVVAVE
ncbi:hypothetical protein F5Y17DRAFT_461333 [Xylariaceae sp. FL0594]|nr:hypothetical protein F5Y17DRAFT_461333 [Xylariaceae sp. FL0594]